MNNEMFMSRARFRAVAVTALLTLLATMASAAIGPGPALAAQSRCTSLTYVRVPDWGGVNPVDFHFPTIGSQTGNLECHLWYGHTGIAVTVLQETLIDCYDQPIRADGSFGPKTQGAVRNAQQMINSWFPEANIAEDGSYGPQTRAWMWWSVYHAGGGPQIPGYCNYP